MNTRVWRLALAVLIALMIAGGVATTWRREQMAERAKTNKAISQVLAARLSDQHMELDEE